MPQTQIGTARPPIRETVYDVYYAQCRQPVQPNSTPTSTPSVSGCCNFCLHNHDPPLYQYVRLHLHARRDELALLARVVLPAAGQRLAARLLRKLLHARLELGPKVADETLDGPGKRLAESYTPVSQPPSRQLKQKTHRKSCGPRPAWSAPGACQSRARGPCPSRSAA